MDDNRFAFYRNDRCIWFTEITFLRPLDFVCIVLYCKLSALISFASIVFVNDHSNKLANVTRMIAGTLIDLACMERHEKPNKF